MNSPTVGPYAVFMSWLPDWTLKVFSTAKVLLLFVIHYSFPEL